VTGERAVVSIADTLARNHIVGSYLYSHWICSIDIC